MPTLTDTLVRLFSEVDSDLRATPATYAWWFRREPVDPMYDVICGIQRVGEWHRYSVLYGSNDFATQVAAWQTRRSA